MPQRLGVLPDCLMPIRDIVECAKLAEEYGFQGIWTTDLTPKDAYMPLTACALATKRIKLGTAVSTISVRSPVLTAALASCLDEISDNRAIIGLGTGSIWLRELGLTPEKPLTAMREYVQVMRKVLSGKEFSYDGEVYRIKNWRWWNLLGYSPSRYRIPIYLAGVGPRMIRLAGEIADGVILGAVNHPRYIETVLTYLKEGASKSRRKVADIDLAALLITSVGKDSKAARKAARAALAVYASFPYYKPVLESAGYGPVRNKIIEARTRGDMTSAVALVSDKMVEDLTLSGTAEECRSKLNEYRRAGLKLPLLYTNLAGAKDPREVYASAIRGLG